MHRSWRLAALAALLVVLPVLVPGAAAQSGFGKNKVQYREFDWKIYHSPHFDVYYYAEEEHLLQKVVSFAESAYDRLSREFDYQIQEPTPLIFYATHSAFEQNNIILNFIPEGIGAFASPARNRMVLPVDLPDPELMALLLHELTHIFEYHVLFQGSLGKSITVQPPQWLMEGLASYMAKDEQTHDRMFVRDAVVNDAIPPITQTGVSGFFAYRFGHATFDYIEERWGKEGLLDFLYEFRNTIGAQVGRAVERTFKMDPEEFDADLRRWLRRKYLPQLVEMGEPSDFGRPFRVEEGVQSEELSPAASPSGDLVAAISTLRGEIDVVLFDAEKRRLLRNLTKGYSENFQYITAQFLTWGRHQGGDIAFSPDGNQLAVFAKREQGRSLVLIDVLAGGLDRIIDMDVEQQLAPAWSPDGRSIAFAGNRNGRFDIFVLDLASDEIRNLTDDEVYDGSPAYSPDGRWLYYSAVVGGFANLFRIDLTNPTQRYRLTEGEFNDVDAVVASDGGQLYFTSDRNGADNIYRLDLASGQVLQYTNAVTGCFMPTLLRQREGPDRLVYTGYWRGEFTLYVTDTDKPIGEPIATDLSPEPELPSALAAFEPDIEVTIDEENKEEYGGWRLFLEDAEAILGVNDDQTFVADTYLIFSDYLGDKRLFARLSSIESFSNFDIAYYDLSSRLQWGVRLFDDRTFYIGFDQSRGQFRRGRAAFRQTGAMLTGSYPFDFSHRVEGGVGYILREIDFQQFFRDPDTGQLIPIIVPREDDYPLVEAGFVGDTTVFASFGPVSGRRYRLGASYAPDLDESGTLTSSVELDARQYIPVTRRSQIALRAFGAVSKGNFPSPYFFGGLDTVRGFDFRTLSGDRVGFLNVEFRFPLIDQLRTPFLNFQGIRGRVFLDVGGGYFAEQGQSFHFWDSDERRLDDGISSYGYGFTVRLLGLDVHWDFAQQWDFKEELEKGFRTSWWIGSRF